MENKRTILLTGSSGFLGSRILNKIRKKHTVYLLNHKNKISKLRSNYIQITVDELDKISKLDEIIHCAGISRGSSSNIWDVNYHLTKKLINLSKQHQAYFLFISTLNAGLTHKGHYENSKYEAERELLNEKIDFLIIRPSYLYDTNYDPNLKIISRFFPLYKLMPILFIPPYDFLVQPLHVNDLVYFCARRIEKKDYLGNIIELAGPSTKSIWDVIMQYFLQNGINIKLIKIPKSFISPLCFCFKNKMNILFQNKILKENKEVISFIVNGNKISEI